MACRCKSLSKQSWSSISPRWLGGKVPDKERLSAEEQGSMNPRLSYDRRSWWSSLRCCTNVTVTQAFPFVQFLSLHDWTLATSLTKRGRILKTGLYFSQWETNSRSRGRCPLCMYTASWKDTVSESRQWTFLNTSCNRDHIGFPNPRKDTWASLHSTRPSSFLHPVHYTHVTCVLRRVLPSRRTRIATLSLLRLAFNWCRAAPFLWWKYGKATATSPCRLRPNLSALKACYRQQYWSWPVEDLLLRRGCSAEGSTGTAWMDHFHLVWELRWMMLIPWSLWIIWGERIRMCVFLQGKQNRG